MIELHDVAKTYSNGGAKSFALKDVSFTADAQQLIAITGKSGSGKSTLLNLLSGIDTPSGGTIRMNGTNLGALSNEKLTKWRCLNVGVIFQSFHLISTLTLLENVMLPMEFAGRMSFRNKKKRAKELLDSVGLSERADYFPDHVSGGQKQRAAIARALANDPPFIMADEPTGNLDSENAVQILRLFEELIGNGKTVVMVTHDMELAHEASQMIKVKDGRVQTSLKYGMTQ